MSWVPTPVQLVEGNTDGSVCESARPTRRVEEPEGRAHRSGQQRPVTVYRLVTAGSIEERIVELHHDQRSLADGILEGQDSAAPLRADDLRALLRGD